ncbi:hypothetical protein PL8927_710112 [Planktothrix serta PCC 8927]|uniref:Uncharacterized protein n=1 Tax=Planktothrix serta PCC 8927 TaxID=671068 RepID=A0A7Z9BRH7_9CYAN|nr:hypothetical protein PL8927_710112 [Planktothrix serta PCC 8927]
MGMREISLLTKTINLIRTTGFKTQFFDKKGNEFNLGTRNIAILNDL